MRFGFSGAKIPWVSSQLTAASIPPASGAKIRPLARGRSAPTWLAGDPRPRRDTIPRLQHTSVASSQWIVAASAYR
jgi:hypothetical protein